MAIKATDGFKSDNQLVIVNKTEGGGLYLVVKH